MIIQFSVFRPVPPCFIQWFLLESIAYILLTSGSLINGIIMVIVVNCGKFFKDKKITPIFTMFLDFCCFLLSRPAKNAFLWAIKLAKI